MERIMDDAITYPVAQGTQIFFEKAATAGLELRTGQVEMAMEICEAIMKTTPLAVEAEVGIGKSYAYLIPAVMKYRNDHRQIVIATSTIALQEQLVKDTQNVLKMTGSYIDIILAKGMRNYLCRRRLRMRLKKKDHPEIYDNLNIALRVNGYDRAKMGFNIPDRIWETVNVQNYNEKCHECPLNDTCGYYELRRNLRSGGGIVICNQNMLVAHFQNVSQKGKGIFNPRGGMIIVDEAHNIESRFRDAYTRSFTCAEMIKVINNCIDKTPYNLKRTVEPYANKTIPVVEQLYKRLVRQVKEQVKELEADTSTYYFERDTETMTLLKELYNRMVRLENGSKVILKSTLSFLKSALNTSNEYIVWLEMEPKLKICVCKKDIRQHISDQLFPVDATTILTSATISDKAAIILKECYDNARKNMSSRSHYYVDGKTKIPFKQTGCAICGGQLFRNRNMDDRIWKCSTVGCANRTNGIKEDRFYSQVLSILMDVQADCSLLDKEAVLTEYKPNVHVRKGENEVVMRCHIKPIDDERIKKKIISLAALKYDCCTYDISKYLTEEIKERLSTCEPLFDIDSLLIKDIVKKVILIDETHVAIEFKNGKTITYGGI